MSKCDFHLCCLDTNDGDGYYCSTHRRAWIEHCKVLGIHEKRVAEYMVTNFKKAFDSNVSVTV